MTDDRSSGPPHVTDILKEAGWIDTQWFTDEACQRGTFVHLAAQLWDQGDLDEESVSGDVWLRLQQYRRFKRESDYVPTLIEAKVMNTKHGYQGTIDRLCCVNGREGILDIKGPGHFDWQGLQLAAYAHCFDRPLARWSLHLHDDKYRLVEWTDRQDWVRFLVALHKIRIHKETAKWTR